MKASVIIPNLNGAGWLRDSIESIWAQTEQDFELIVIDNGSTDESLAIARSYCGRDRYTRALRSPRASTQSCSTTTPLPSRTGWPSLSGPPMPTRRFLRSAA